MYLETFCLPVEQEDRLLDERMFYNGGIYGYVDNVYPCGLFRRLGRGELRFGRVTIFYGGNGSGKSTLLNLIAQRLGLQRNAPCNSGEMFAAYAAACRYETGCDEDGAPLRIPDGSRILTSDDVFDYMLAVRANNDEILQEREKGRDVWAEQKYGSTVKMNGLEDYEALRLQVLARSSSMTRRKFLRATAGQEARLASNGETALQYFEARLESDRLYCLDEPENSMSPRLQLELAGLLGELSRYCGCQLILATHSPFLLAMENARIYDLDHDPVTVRSWWELENTRTYYEFFKQHQALFETGI